METSDVQPVPVEERMKLLEGELRTTQDELTTVKKQLVKTQRQLETAETYNEDLRKQVDSLNQELHRHKRRQMEDRACQTEEMLGPWAVEASQQLPNPEANPEASISEIDTTGMSLADSLRATAEAALSQTGTVYDESSGMYYDYTTGMYYDPNNHLHYEPNTGIYYYYDEQTQSYQFHSQVELPASYGTDQGEETEVKQKKKKQKNREKKKRKEPHKDESEVCEVEVIVIDEDKEGTKQHDKKGHRKKKKHKAEQEEVEVIDITMSGDAVEGTTEQEEHLGTYEHNSDQNQPAVEEVADPGIDADLEEGEVVDSGEEDDDAVVEGMEADRQSEESDCSEESDESDESTMQWPPCIRVMVQESDTLRPGSLFIVTCDGGTIGREKDMGHAIRIPDLNISKTHVEINYNREEGHYTISDLGSQNGSLLNGQRISEMNPFVSYIYSLLLQPKCKSAPCPLAHKDQLQLGGTLLSLHIHNGNETCDECEPGQVMAAIAARERQEQQAEELPVQSKEDKEKQRRRELKQIKKKYQLENVSFVVNKEAIQNPGYKDRAGERREAVGSDNPYQKDDAPSSVHEAIGTSNKGRKMLEKMGWKEGKGLGKTSQGRQEPVQVSLRDSHAGLGAAAPRDVESIQWRTGKGKNWRKARERFYAMEQANQTSHPSGMINETNAWVKGETIRTENEPSVDNGMRDVEHITEDQRKGSTQQGPVDKGLKIFDD